MEAREAMLEGSRILLVEDEYLLASLLKEILEDLGAEVIGPFARVGPALDSLHDDAMPQIALLDVNLGGEDSFPIADALARHDIPSVLLTGYDAGTLPERYRHLPCLYKPIDLAAIHRGFVPLAANAAGGGRGRTSTRDVRFDFSH